MTGEQVYIGLRCIGEVVERDSRRFEALDHAGGALGVFPSRAKALQAIYERDHEERDSEASAPGGAA